MAPRSSRLVRVTLTGPELAGFPRPEPAASIRLLLPVDGLVELPRWDGNVFLRADGRRATIRTLTPLRLDPAVGRLDVEIVRPGRGAVSVWVEAAAPGVEVAVSGPARGYTVDPDASEFLLAGDLSAVPAIGQLLEALPGGVPAHVWIEGPPDAPLPERPVTTVEWEQDLVGALEQAPIGAATRVWAAGEAATMQRIRRLLFEARQVSRRQATVRGYWKAGRAGDEDD